MNSTVDENWLTGVNRVRFHRLKNGGVIARNPRQITMGHPALDQLCKQGFLILGYGQV